jgi:hypothetical protein
LDEEIKQEQKEKKMARMTDKEKKLMAEAEMSQAKLGDKLPERQGPNLKDLFAKHIDQIKLDDIDEQTGLTPEQKEEAKKKLAKEAYDKIIADPET